MSSTAAIVSNDSESTKSPPFDVLTHIRYDYESVTEEQRSKIEQLRSAVADSHAELFSEHKEWLTDNQIIRLLVARNFNVKHALDMTIEALNWRSLRKPAEIMNAPDWSEKMSRESATGKIYCPGLDRWGRSVLVLDNTVQNTNSVDDQMTFLAWNLEFAIKIMPPQVDKYLVFVNLSNWSFFNQSPLSVARETMLMLATCYPERLGHCIAYRPPSIFKTCWNMLKGFLDPKTVQKIVFITGDVSDDSENDKSLRMIIGDNWKTLTGGEQPVLQRGCSPGYDHSTFWPTVQQRLDQLQLNSNNNSGSGNNNSADEATIGDELLHTKPSAETANTTTATTVATGTADTDTTTVTTTTAAATAVAAEDEFTSAEEALEELHSSAIRVEV